jgi:hypothetical protein
VTIGISNTRFTEMLSGDLKPGDELITRRAETPARRSDPEPRGPAGDRARGLTKSYRNGDIVTPVLHGITLTCNAATSWR